MRTRTQLRVGVNLTSHVIFVNRSITTKMLLNELDGDRSVMKSIETEGHGQRGTNNGCRSPYRRC